MPGALGSIWQALKHLQPLATVRYCFNIGRSHIAALAGSLPVLHCLLCKAGLRVVMRQQFGLRLYRLRKSRFQLPGKLRMVALTRARQQRLIGYLLGQGVLEGVGALREQTRFVEELGGLEVSEPRCSAASASSAMACKRGRGTSVPMTAAACSSCFSSGGSRSMRAANTACTVAGTWMVGRRCARR